MVLDTVEVDGKRLDVQGECATAFEPVLRTFVENFRDRRELGASYCVYQEGKKVVDIWAGHRDPERTQDWAEDTLVGMASVIKGMLAMALHMLADQGKISYSAPVAEYWPEFAQDGKEEITVRQAISHHAAVHFCDAAEPGDMYRWNNFVAAVAKQEPEWKPGTRGVYHTLTIVPIMGHLIECVSGQRAWDFFREQVTDRLGVDYHIRMQAEELARFSGDYETEAFFDEAPASPEVMARFFKPIGDPAAIGSVLTPEELADIPFQSAGGTARAGARLFAFAALDGELEGVRIFSPETIDLMTEVQWDEPCAVWGTPMATALGLLRNNSFFYVGPNPRAFGTAGAGGSFAMADRENRLSVGYSLNRWWKALALGDRARALIDATYACI